MRQNTLKDSRSPPGKKLLKDQQSGKKAASKRRVGLSATMLSRANSGDRLPRGPLDRLDSQACNGRSKGNHIQCIRSVQP